ncbi:MAG: OmpA family protein [Planctomycetes bacterium]|nr:OmpA family protein [Planctomycetota bacterium]
MATANETIIIKRVKKIHGGGHHGGQWKVAYADFVTAMMAFFLMLWLLNATTSEQMAGIANYFSPTALSYTDSGAGGMLGGATMLAPGAMDSATTEGGATVSLMPLNENEIPDVEGLPAEKKGTLEEDDVLDEPGALGKSKDAYNEESESGEKAEELYYSRNLLDVEALDDESAATLLRRLEQQGFGEIEVAVELLASLKKGEMNGADVAEEMREMLKDEGFEGSKAAQELLAMIEAGRLAAAGVSKELLRELEQRDFERAEAALRESIASSPALREFSQNLIIDMTPQGMRIQIADAEQRSMFPSGSAAMYDYTEELLSQIVQAIMPLPNDIAIVGHTDATPYHSGADYTNWELSTDRANSSRRALIAAGLPAERIVRVVGKADHDPLDKNDPFSAQNRRISVLILREYTSSSLAQTQP